MYHPPPPPPPPLCTSVRTFIFGVVCMMLCLCVAEERRRERWRRGRNGERGREGGGEERGRERPTNGDRAMAFVVLRKLHSPACIVCRLLLLRSVIYMPLLGPPLPPPPSPVPSPSIAPTPLSFLFSVYVVCNVGLLHTHETVRLGLTSREGEAVD